MADNWALGRGIKELEVTHWYFLWREIITFQRPVETQNPKTKLEALNRKPYTETLGIRVRG